MKIRDRIVGLERVKASELRPSPANWRTHNDGQRDALKGILSDIGYADVLITRQLEDGTYELIDGHLRAETTPDMEVPVLVTDLTEEEAKKLLLTLDPLAAMADADTAKLDALLHEVSTSNEALAAMLSQLAEEHGIVPAGDDTSLVEPEAQVDRAAELLEKWQVKRGNLYAIRSNWCKCPKCGKVQKVQP